MPVVLERVGELLELSGILSNVHVTLDEVAELSLEVNGAMQLIVAKLSLDGGPDDVGVWLADADNGEDVLGDGVVQPAENTLVEETPFGITALLGGLGRGEVVAEAELADECVEEGATFGVVGLGELEHDGNMGLDDHCLENSGGWSGDSWGSAGVGFDGGGRGGGGGVGDVAVK